MGNVTLLIKMFGRMEKFEAHAQMIHEMLCFISHDPPSEFWTLWLYVAEYIL